MVGGRNNSVASPLAFGHIEGNLLFINNVFCCPVELHFIYFVLRCFVYVQDRLFWTVSIKISANGKAYCKLFLRKQLEFVRLTVRVCEESHFIFNKAGINRYQPL